MKWDDVFQVVTNNSQYSKVTINLLFKKWEWETEGLYTIVYKATGERATKSSYNDMDAAFRAAKRLFNRTVRETEKILLG